MSTRNVILSVISLAAGVLLAIGIYQHAEAQGAAERRAELAQADGYAGQPNAMPLYAEVGSPVQRARVAALESALPSAAEPSDAPDPKTDPGGFIAKVHKLWKAGALAPAIILAAFGAAVLLGFYVPWINEGSRKLIFASVVLFLSTLAEPAARGTTPSMGMVLSAATAALLLYLNSRGQPKPPGTVTPIKAL